MVTRTPGWTIPETRSRRPARSWSAPPPTTPLINTRAWFSNYGSRIVVCAPGDSSHDLTCSSGSDSAYRNDFGGTSGATPKVAGVAALMLAANPGLSHAEIRRILNVTGTAVTTDPGKDIGTFLNASAAVQEASVGAVGRLEVFARGARRCGVAHVADRPEQRLVRLGLAGRLDRYGHRRPQCRRQAGDLRPRRRRCACGTCGRLPRTTAGAAGPRSVAGSTCSTVARNADGRLEVFARGGDGALWHMWQTAPNNGWTGWSSLGGWIDDAGRRAERGWPAGDFRARRGQALWHMWQTAPNNGWSGWASLGGWIDLLACWPECRWQAGDLRARRRRRLCHMWQTAPNNGWSDWASLGGWIDLAGRCQKRGWPPRDLRPRWRRRFVAYVADGPEQWLERLGLVGRLDRPARSRPE